MKELNQYISEKLIVNNSIQNNDIPDDFQTSPIHLIKNSIKFPLKLQIGNNIENIIGYIENNNNIYHYYHYYFYNDQYEKICTMTQKEILLIFDDNKSLMLNTKYGCKSTKFLK